MYEYLPTFEPSNNVDPEILHPASTTHPAPTTTFGPMTADGSTVADSSISTFPLMLSPEANLSELSCLSD
jgi:hypothetical protein